MKNGISAVTAVLMLTSSISSANADSSELNIRSVDLYTTAVEGGRGAALAVLKDGTLLLAGGRVGDTLFQYQNDQLTSLGKLLKQSERERDSRFGPTDIAVLSENTKRLQLLISYPQLNKPQSCVRLVVFRFTVDRVNQSIAKQERWFLGKPCVPVGAVQHAAGRMQVIDSKSAYLTTGDLGFRKINQVSARGWLGGVLEISAKSVKQISRGHRNPQGILSIGSDLYISEHGPRGGDEINLIKQNKDYGWPFVTFGAPYGPGDYIKPGKTGVHTGYEPPIYQWTPSVAPTELVQLPNNQNWKQFANHIVMGTLAAQSLIFMELTAPDKIGKVTQIDIGERVRDLEVMPGGDLVATTDSGRLLFINLR